jgi:hypothetical protein
MFNCSNTEPSKIVQQVMKDDFLWLLAKLMEKIGEEEFILMATTARRIQLAMTVILLGREVLQFFNFYFQKLDLSFYNTIYKLIFKEKF